jgi:hypothetical protein
MPISRQPGEDYCFFSWKTPLQLFPSSPCNHDRHKPDSEIPDMQAALPLTCPSPKQKRLAINYSLNSY